MQPLERVSWVRDVFILDVVESTNAEALRLAGEGAPEGTVVLGRRQTAGRGRLGRAWWSEPGASLTASWIVRPALSVERWPVLSLAAGLAASGALREHCGLDVTLKWPNDVLWRGRKIGGLLAEARPPEAVVIGLGVNLGGRPPPELDATTVLAAGGGRIDATELLGAVLVRFASELADLDGVPRRYRERCGTLGRLVRVERPAAPPVAGIARDVDECGALVVETDGEVLTLTSGDVSHLRPA